MKTQLTAETRQAPAGLLIFSCTCLLLMHPEATCGAGAAFLAVGSLCKVAVRGEGSPC